MIPACPTAMHHRTTGLQGNPGTGHRARTGLPRAVTRALLLLFLALGPALLVARAQTPELRGWWADTFHAALRTPAEVDALVANARAARCNAVFVEVRKRGDAYYDSRFEPKASDVQAGFDPLARLVTQAHNTAAGPRLQVHAWIVTYNIWNNPSTPPPQADHPYRLHPDWLTESATGEKWDGSNYAFDPGHPAVQEHTFNVAMDLVTRYDIDGLHFDYVRYAGREWGYNPTALTRYLIDTGNTGRPAPDDSAWMQWRRDQVTKLLRRVYLAVAAHQPHVTVSAATITWTPTATTFPTWLKAAAWSDVLQDWRGWMEEGILDLNVPMAYFRQETHATAWSEWGRFAREHRYQRHLALGAAGYLNLISNTLVQMRSTRVQLGPTLPKADGVLVYSYAVPASQGTRADFIAALTTPTAHDSVSPPIFATAVAPPDMPWKTDGSRRGLAGVVTDATTGKRLDRAQVEFCDPTPGVLLADVNGAFGRLLDATPSGLVVSASGYATRIIELAPGSSLVLETNLALTPDSSALRPLNLRISPGREGAVVSWRTTAPGRGGVLFGTDATCGPETGVAWDNRLDTFHSVLIGDLPDGNAGTPGGNWLRVISESPGGETNLSYATRVLPARSPLLVDEWEVRRTGDWTFNPVGTASTRPGYWRTPSTTGAPTATALWTAPIEVTGFYDVGYSLLPGPSGFTATYEVNTPRTNLSIRVTHSGAALLSGTLATNLYLYRGERPAVRLANQVSAGSQTLAAGRVLWTYRPAQDPPPAESCPDWWIRHFFRAGADPRDDDDGDGLANHVEYAFGTDPTNPDSVLRLWLEPAPEDGWRLRFSPGVTRRAYSLEATPAPGQAPWMEVPVAPPVALPSGDWEMQVPAGETTARFYRLKVRTI